MERKIQEIKPREEIGEELGSGEIGGIYIGITSDIDRDVMMLFQD